MLKGYRPETASRPGVCSALRGGTDRITATEPVKSLGGATDLRMPLFSLDSGKTSLQLRRPARICGNPLE